MKHEPRLAIHTEKLQWWAHKLGRVESQVISRAEQTVLARFMESEIWHQPAGSVVLSRESSEWDNGLCPPVCLGENYPPALTLMPDTVPARMPPLLFKLLPQCWSSERVSLSR